MREQIWNFSFFLFFFKSPLQRMEEISNGLWGIGEIAFCGSWEAWEGRWMRLKESRFFWEWKLLWKYWTGIWKIASEGIMLCLIDLTLPWHFAFGLRFLPQSFLSLANTPNKSPLYIEYGCKKRKETYKFLSHLRL